MAIWSETAYFLPMSLILAPGTRLVAATHNPGKAKELAELLDGRFDLVAAGALGLPEPEETEASFVGNALLKARRAADASGLIALADDSGLSVAALDGAPGIYSARWAGPSKDFVEAMAKVEERIEATGSDDRSAWFTCALAVAWPRGPAVVVEGRIDGVLSFPPRGDRGFRRGWRFPPSRSSACSRALRPPAASCAPSRRPARPASRAASSTS